MELEALLNQLRLDPGFMSNVAAWERIPARPARYAEFPPLLDSRLVTALRSKGLNPLYVHQAEAIDAALDGQNVVLVTGTASGKSLAYHIPTLQYMLQQPGATALYLFPTKALSQDQAAALAELLAAIDEFPRIPVNVYDGDTPQGHRTRIREESGIVITIRICPWAYCLITRVGQASSRTCESSSWTSCIHIVASSAATWRMCYGG
jgi:DEAD/DEAH box helicase domain-containing protein